MCYYEVFASGRIIKRLDLPDRLRQGDVLGGRRNPLGLDGIYVSAFTGGFPLAVDLRAYLKGTAPQPGVTSRVIVERLGAPIAGVERTQAQVPNVYASEKFKSIAGRIAHDNFYEAADMMLERAKGTLPLEERRLAFERDKAILIGLVPFVGACQDFAAGNIGSGLFALALDLGGLALGAGGRARSLIRAGAALARNPLSRSIGRLGNSVRPLAPKIGWSKPVASFSDRAFNFINESVLFASAAMNPVDGYGQLVNAGVKGVFNLPAIASGTLKLNKAVPHLIAVEEKLRAYWLAGGSSRSSAQVIAPGADADGS